MTGEDVYRLNNGENIQTWKKLMEIGLGFVQKMVGMKVVNNQQRHTNFLKP
jgi:hypothetical protein